MKLGLIMMPLHDPRRDYATVLREDREAVILADRLVALGDEVGPFGTLVMTAHDGDDGPLWRRSMRLLAEDVMPSLARHAAAHRRLA